MTMANVLEVLIAERDLLNQAIALLQGDSAPKRRGRKPAAAAAKASPRKGGGRKMSAKARKAVSERMSKYWAARRKAAAKDKD